jgi:polar amino acid transport system ATP-binding protein
MPQQALISVEQLQKQFGSELVLAGTTLQLFPNQIAGLIGESGSGKSVLCKCITGLESFDHGIVRIADAFFGPHLDMFDPTWTVARQTVGCVLQETVLPPYRMILELICEGLVYVEGLSWQQASEKSSKRIKLLRLEPLLKKYPHELSAGQIARVKLARALARNPRYLICDEVTANVDPILAGEIGEQLLALTEEGIGLLLVSHQLDFLHRHASVVHFLSGGTVKYSGPPQDIIESPQPDDLRRFVGGVRRGY